MSALIFLAAAMLQHEGHGGHGTAPPATADPHAGHAMPPAAAPDPHAGHAMPKQADPHAGHEMLEQADPHAGHVMGGTSAPPILPAPPGAMSGPAHAADTIFDPAVMAAAREAIRSEHGGMTTGRVMIDRLEARMRDGREGYAWDGDGWWGGDIDKLWVKTEGEGDFGGAVESAEVQALWSHAIDPWFDLQAGLRYDFRPEPNRAHLVIGVQGLAPYWIEVDAAAFLSDKSDLTARIEAEYDQRITQSLTLQPRVELELAAQDVPEIGIGAGLSTIEAGLRLRYEFVPEFAPYVGVEWERAFGRAARLREAAGESAGGWGLVLGVRAWF